MSWAGDVDLAGEDIDEFIEVTGTDVGGPVTSSVTLLLLLLQLVTTAAASRRPAHRPMTPPAAGPGCCTDMTRAVRDRARDRRRGAAVVIHRHWLMQWVNRLVRRPVGQPIGTVQCGRTSKEGR